jgi:serine/threonine protein kinase
VDGRSDLYSLGCVVYEMLIGEPPFHGPTPQVVLARQSAGTIPSVRTVRPTVPIPVEAAVFRALALVPADRFATVDEFCEALVQVEQLGTGATPPVAIPMAGRRQRRRWLIAGGAAAVLALAAVAAILLKKPGAAPPLGPQRVVVALFENRTGDSSLDDIGAWLRLDYPWACNSGLLNVVPCPRRCSRQVSRVRRDQPAAERPDSRLGETGAGLVISGSCRRETRCSSAQVSSAVERRQLGALDPSPVKGRSVQAIEEIRDADRNHCAHSRSPVSSIGDDGCAAADAPSGSSTPAWRVHRERLSRGGDRLPAAFSWFNLHPDLLYAAINHSNLREMAQMDSVLRVVARSGQLSEYDQRWLEHLEAQVRETGGASRHSSHRRALAQASQRCLARNPAPRSINTANHWIPTGGDARLVSYWVQKADAYRLGDHRRGLERPRRLNPVPRSADRSWAGRRGARCDGARGDV